MNKPARIILFFSFLLLSIFASQAVLAMPPHPDLKKEFDEGKKPVPDFIKNPQKYRDKGIDQPVHKPKLKRPSVQGAPLLGPAGDFRALAILVDFSDKVQQVQASYFDTVIFGATGSTVRTYYNEVSYGTLTIVTVDLPSSTGWFRAPRTYSYYVNGQHGWGTYPQNAQKLVEDVVDAADAVVDYSQYDNDADDYVDALFIVHAGPGAEYTDSANDIWSHMWTINPRLKDGVYLDSYSMEPEYWAAPGDMTCGVFSHELGHVLGLPDLYDTDYTSEGVGRWSLMATGSWNGTLGNSPAHFDAWSRAFLDFVTPTVITTDIPGLSLPAVENTPNVYYLWNCGGANSEYFLIEYRKKVGFDAGLPESGLLLWHVDENKLDNSSECKFLDNCNCATNYKVALEQADGLLELEYNYDQGDAGDPFPGSTNKRSGCAT